MEETCITTEDWQEGVSIDVVACQTHDDEDKASDEYQEGNSTRSKFENSDEDDRCIDSPFTNGNAEDITNNIKVEQVNLMGATADESMAVEALSQLGGMFNMTDMHTLDVGGKYVEEPPPCDTCGMQFQTSYELQNHVAVCQPLVARVHVCNVCGENFERKADLGNHIVCHQTDRPHSCRMCGNLFARKADLVNHMVSHQLNRPHQCPECGVDFQRPSSLTNHMKIHKYHPGRSMIPSITDLGRENNCNLLQIPASNKMDQTLLTLSTYANDDLTIPPAVYHETITQEKQQSSGENEVIRISAYGSWNADTGSIINEMETVPNQESNSHLDYQNMPFTQQLQGNHDLEHFNYFQDITECTTIDVETTTAESNGNDDFPMMNNLKCKGSLSFDSEKFNNASVKVEAVPYFLPEESEIGDAVYTVDSNGRQCVTMQDKQGGSRPHVCLQCDMTFSRIKALQAHARTHQDYWEGPLECKKCCEAFTDAASLRQHFCTIARIQESKPESIKSNTPAAPVNQPKYGKHFCTSCDKRFTTKQKLFRHMWIHRKKHFVCEVCNLSLSHQEGLDDHRRSMHPGETPFVCHSCGKSFASRQGLWEHGRVHGGTNVSLFWCHECNKSFSSRQGYLIHTRTHTGERPYGCRFCMKAFRDGGTLRKHERIHTGERPHVCPLCYRAFNQKVVLREHVRWVHAANRSGEETDEEHLYTCQVCNQLLGDREELCAHIVKHSDDLAKAAKIKGDTTSNSRQGNNSKFKEPLQVHPRPVNYAKIKEIKLNMKMHTKKKTKKAKAVVIDDKALPLQPTPFDNALEKANGMLIPPSDYTFQFEVSTVKEVYAHTCGMCDESFKDRMQLLSHVRIHI